MSRTRIPIAPAIAMSCLIVICGCAGSGEGLDANGLPLATNSNGSLGASEFDAIQQSILTPICTGCHAGANAPVGLRLEAGFSYALLVGVPSDETPTLQRVQPGNADASYLIQKLRGVSTAGDRMPLGGPYLSQSAIDQIAQWILNGAPPPASNAANKPSDTGVEVVGASVTANRIALVFDRPVDMTLVSEDTVSLHRDGEVGVVPTTFAAPNFNPYTLLIAPQKSLAPGDYVLTLRGRGGGALADLNGRPLNARDGETGADVSMTLTVETAQ